MNVKNNTNDIKVDDFLLTEINNLKNTITKIQSDIEELRKLVLSHENELKQRKVIKNTYVDTILSKIQILKNMINENLEDSFISSHLIEVESIEEQIIKTGKISDSQFQKLNDIYLKQKRMQKS